MKKALFAVALLFIFMFTFVNVFSVSDSALYPLTVTETTSVMTTGVDLEAVTTKELINEIVLIVKASAGDYEDIDELVNKIVGILNDLENYDFENCEKSIDEISAELESLGIDDAEYLLKALKEKIKSVYAGEVATNVTETTESNTVIDKGVLSFFTAFFNKIKSFLAGIIGFLNGIF